MPFESGFHPEERKILIVDDEVNLCKMLFEYLSTTYLNVDTAYSVSEATGKVGKTQYDVIVTDLRLDDGIGTDILRFAKERDPYIEVIIITGFGTLETASEAINLGATSYLSKPLKLRELSYQVEKAIASRIFHLKSLKILDTDQNEEMGYDRDHLHNMTALYQFASKLMLTLDINEIMKIILRELNDKLETLYSTAAINYLGYKEVYAMPFEGKISKERVAFNFISNWQERFQSIMKEDFEEKIVPIEILNSKNPDADIDNSKIGRIITLPLSVLGENMGFLSLFLKEKDDMSKDKHQFFYVLTSLISSAIQHCYLNAQAREQAKTDALTGVANHRLFHEMLDREIARARRSGGEFSIVLLDIDDFKKVNDTYGHLVGDSVLIDFTKRITSLIRKSDLLARYGGEEFILILADTGREGAAHLSERIRSIVADKPHQFSGNRIAYTTSAGFTTYNKESDPEKTDLIEVADKALYRAKNSGKNRVEEGIFSGKEE